MSQRLCSIERCTQMMSQKPYITSIVSLRNLFSIFLNEVNLYHLLKSATCVHVNFQYLPVYRDF